MTPKAVVCWLPSLVSGKLLFAMYGVTSRAGGCNKRRLLEMVEALRQQNVVDVYTFANAVSVIDSVSVSSLEDSNFLASFSDTYERERQHIVDEYVAAYCRLHACSYAKGGMHRHKGTLMQKTARHLVHYFRQRDDLLEPLHAGDDEERNATAVRGMAREPIFSEVDRQIRRCRRRYRRHFPLLQYFQGRCRRCQSQRGARLRHSEHRRERVHERFLSRVPFGHAKAPRSLGLGRDPVS